MTSLRILFLGENWYGSCARACCYALRRLGHDVLDIDSQTVVPPLRRRASRGLVRALLPWLVREYNEIVLETAAEWEPDVVLAFKAPYVTADTLRRLRARGVKLYNYYPDTSVFAHGPWLPDALAEYDCVFFTKHFGEADARRRISVREACFVPHGYDPDVHRPWPLSARDVEHYGHDVIVIATYTPSKERLLAELLARVPGLDLRIWGNQWRARCRSSAVRAHVAGSAVSGSTYARAIRAARINLAIMSGQATGASQGDDTTTRTYEIPACGGFMLHERSTELRALFEEGTEVGCFDTPDELVERIRYYLAHDDERMAMARAGHERCVPAYSYDTRMQTVMAWHLLRPGGRDVAMTGVGRS
jgi:spore maturation protein CgeB